MPRRKPTDDLEARDLEKVEVEAPKPASLPKAIKAREVVRPARRVSFEQWASLRGIKQSHKRGLRAFISDPTTPRSFKAWDQVFKDY